MATLRPAERTTIERFLGMSGGYVLDLGNAAFREFVRDSTGRDIECGAYDSGSNSKARRLRKFFEVEPDETIGGLLRDLAEHRSAAVTPAERDDGFLRDLESVQATAARLRLPDHPLNEPAKIQLSVPYGGGPESTGEPMLLEDGTNLPEGTDYAQTVEIDGGYLVPAEHAETAHWQDQLAHLRDRLRAYREGARPVRAWLSQRNTPLPGPATAPAELRKTYSAESRQALEGFSGCRLEHAAPLRALRGGMLPTLFPFKGRHGVDITYPNGTAVPMRLGLHRQLAFFNGSNAVSEDRPLRWAALHEILRDCGKLLPKLPAGHLCAIWKAWGGTIPRYKQPNARWMEAVFEHGWGRSHGGDGAAPLRAAYDESGYCSVVLHGSGRFPHVPPSSRLDPRLNVPHYWGYPAEWHSKIDDVAAESLDLLDWMMTFDPPAAEPGPLNLFISYSHEDEGFREDLGTVINPLERARLGKVWHDRRLLPGQNLDSVIDAKLGEVDVFIYLLSRHFLGSNYCLDELDKGLARARAGQAVVVGVAVRKCDPGDHIPDELLRLPKDGLPVNDWGDADHAWADVSKNLRLLLQKLTTSPKPWTDFAPHA